jgi:hypothetical protein
LIESIQSWIYILTPRSRITMPNQVATSLRQHRFHKSEPWSNRKYAQKIGYSDPFIDPTAISIYLWGEGFIIVCGLPSSYIQEVRLEAHEIY